MIMDFADKCYRVFGDTTRLYHEHDNVTPKVDNP